MKSIIVTTILALAASACGAQDYPLQKKAETDLPSNPLASATLFGLCQNRKQVLAGAVFVYSDGTIVRITPQQMHGFTTAQQIAEYAMHAKDYDQIVEICGDTST